MRKLKIDILYWNKIFINLCFRNKEPKIELVYDRKFIGLYGLQPKFIRMRELHKFMFYLTRAYDGQEVTDREMMLNEIRKEVGSNLDQTIQDELSEIKVYHKGISWKSFVPPLPIHQVN